MTYIDPPRATWTEGDLVRALSMETGATRELIQAIAAAVVLAPALSDDASIEDALLLARRVLGVLVPDAVPSGAAT